MNKKSYREILIQYIQEHKVEEAILTDQVVQYAAKELGKDAEDVKKAVNVTMARLEKNGYIIRVSKGVYCKKLKTAFGFYMPNKDDLFCRQLLQNKDNIIGYETGFSALNRLGLISQMPKKYVLRPICIKNEFLKASRLKSESPRLQLTARIIIIFKYWTRFGIWIGPL